MDLAAGEQQTFLVWLGKQLWLPVGAALIVAALWTLGRMDSSSAAWGLFFGLYPFGVLRLYLQDPEARWPFVACILLAACTLVWLVRYVI